MWIDVEQNAEEWFQLRAGKVTSSSLNKVMANYGKAFGDPAKKYAVEIAVQQLGGVIDSGSFTNAHMERGHEEEPLAIMAYEEEYFCEVTNGGFFDLGKFGDSPDGLVDNKISIEVKSAIPSVHYNRMSKKTYDTSYKWQICGHFKADKDIEFVDFISYCSSFPTGKKLYVYRCSRNDFKSDLEKVEIRLKQFYQLIDDIKSNIQDGNYSVMGDK